MLAKAAQATKGKALAETRAPAAGQQVVGMAPQTGGLAGISAWNLDPFDSHNLVPPEVQHTVGAEGLPDEVLRYLARTPLIDALHSTMINDLASFHVQQPHRFAPGYVIAMRDPNAKGTRASKKRAKEIADWVATCGDPRLQEDPTFETWARKCFRDSLPLDRFCSEIVHDRRDKIAGFVHVDAATIRRGRPSKREIEEGRRNPHETGFVQIMNSKVVATFDTDEMIFGIRRPRGEARVNGYGFPELEVLIRYITYLINAEVYNAANFTNGVHEAGVGVLKSKMSPEAFRVWERKWYALLDGAAKAKKMPILQLDADEKEDFKAVTLSKTSREMEFNEWLGYNFKGVCFVHGVDPAELSIVYGNEGQSSSMTSSGPSERIKASKKRWRDPTLRAEQGWLNRSMIYKIDPDFELQFVGLDPETEQARLDNMAKAGKVHKTLNELRAMDDLEPLLLPEPDSSPADWGPMDQVYISAVQAQLAAKQAPPGAGGDPNAQDPNGDPFDGEDDPGDDDPSADDLPEDPDLADVFGDDKADDKPGKTPKGKPDETDDEPEPDAPPAKLKKGRVTLRSVTVEA